MSLSVKFSPVLLVTILAFAPQAQAQSQITNSCSDQENFVVVDDAFYVLCETELMLRVLGFHEEEAVMGLVLMSEGFTLDETIRCLTTKNIDAPRDSLETYTENIDAPRDSLETYTENIDAPRDSLETYTENIDAPRDSLETYTENIDAPRDSLETYTENIDAPRDSLETYNENIDAVESKKGRTSTWFGEI